MGQTLGGGRSQGYQGLRDMLDGGGAGATGSEFQGGLLSQLANSLGIRPMGSRERQMGMGQIRPQMGPQVSAQGPMASPTPSPRPGPQPSAGPAVYEQQRAPQLGGGPAIYEQMRGREPMGPPMAPIGQPGPPTRARVSPRPADLLDQFEAQIAASPIGARLRDQMNANPDAVEALMLQWVRNGYKLPGM